MSGPEHPLHVAARILVALAANPATAAMAPDELAKRAFAASFALQAEANQRVIVDGEDLGQLEVGPDGMLWFTLEGGGLGNQTTIGPTASMSELHEAARAAVRRVRPDRGPPTPRPRRITPDEGGAA